VVLPALGIAVAESQSSLSANRAIAALGFPTAALARPLIVLAGALMLAAATLNAVELFAAHRISGPLGSYELNVEASVIRLLGWLALSVGSATPTSGWGARRVLGPSNRIFEWR
jgi:hypothetical protein